MQEHSIQQFQSEQFGTIRTTTIDGEPWFVASDIAKALGYADATHMTRRLDEDEKGLHSMETLGGNQKMSVINEPGLYNAILGSKVDGAKAFKRWVTHEVLPSIRKHGMYATPLTVEDMLSDPDTMIRTLQALKAERQKVEALTEDNARMLPKAMAYDSYIDTDGTFSIQSAARFLAQVDNRITGKRLYALLRADELVCKQSRCPTKKAIDRGLAMQKMAKKTNGDPAEPYVHLTQKGVDWCLTHYVTIPAQMRAM